MRGRREKGESKTTIIKYSAERQAERQKEKGIYAGRKKTSYKKSVNTEQKTKCE
jgi:hypothetical protein